MEMVHLMAITENIKGVPVKLYVSTDDDDGPFMVVYLESYVTRVIDLHAVTSTEPLVEVIIDSKEDADYFLKQVTDAHRDYLAMLDAQEG
jgi:hypothetical protein